MSKEQFLRNVHSAHRRLVKAARKEPVAVAHGPVASAGRKADWLSPQAVADFNPDDFADLSAAKRDELVAAVNAFSESLRDSSINGTAEAAGRVALSRIGGILSEYIRTEWLEAIERLYADVVRWAEAREWGTKRDLKRTQDSLLGSNEVPVLLIHTPQGRLLLSPEARFVSGGTGLVEFCAMPSFDSARFVRDERGWEVFADWDGYEPRPLTEAVFLDVAQRLLQNS
jgi:hypothetical protein